MVSYIMLLQCIAAILYWALRYLNDINTIISVDIGDIADMTDTDNID